MKVLRAMMLAAVCATTTATTAASYRDVERTNVFEIESVTPTAPSPAVASTDGSVLITPTGEATAPVVTDTTMPATTVPATSVPDMVVPATTAPSDLVSLDPLGSAPVDTAG